MKQKITWRKKGLVLLLMVCLVCGLAACGKGEQQEKKTGDTEGSGNKVEQENTDDQKPKDNQDNQDKQNKDGEESGDTAYEFLLPLTEEPEELSIWWVWSDPTGQKENLVEQPGQAALAEVTNVKIKYNNVMGQEANEKFGLLLASGDLPDMIREQPGSASYPGGMELAVEDGIYLDLTDLYEKYMPHYKALRESNETVRKDTITDSGKIVGIYSLRCNDEGTVCEELPWIGLQVRKDWLEKADLDTPVTIADWEEMLTVFKEQFGAEAPLMLGKNGWYTYDAFLSAYGVSHDFYQENGVVKFGPAEEGYLSYLELMADWYQKGLIDPNFTSNDASFMTYFPEYINNGKTGVAILAYTLVGNYFYNMGSTTDPDFYLEAVNYPVLNEGEVSQTRCNSGMITQNPVVVTTSCKNPELAVKWLDFLYTKEAMEYQCYGVENETYTIDENGNYAYTDYIMENPDGRSREDMVNSNVLQDGTGIITWESVHKILRDDYTVEAKEIWAKDETSIMMPGKLTLTADEAALINLDVTSLQTARDEATVKVIMGNMTIEDYKKTVDSYYSTMNLERCLSVYQAALDRYNAR